MRPVSGTKGNLRGSALWGKKTKGEARSSALWGKPGRNIAAFLAIITVLAAPVAAPAKNGPGHGQGSQPAFAPSELASAPLRSFHAVASHPRSPRWPPPRRHPPR